jgi:hypothetical protein
MQIVAERFWPGTTRVAAADAIRRLRTCCERLSADGVDVRWLGATFVPEDEALSCRFEGAPSAVRAVHELAGQPFDRLLQIVEFGGDPADW